MTASVSVVTGTVLASVLLTNNFTAFDQSKAKQIATAIVNKTQAESTSIDNLKQQLTNYFGSEKVSSIDITNNPTIPHTTVSDVVVNFNNTVNFGNH